MMPGLKMPCPWCGENEMETRFLSTDEHDELHVRCQNCGAMGPEADDVDGAVKSWDEREVME